MLETRRIYTQLSKGIGNYPGWDIFIPPPHTHYIHIAILLFSATQQQCCEMFRTLILRHSRKFFSRTSKTFLPNKKDTSRKLRALNLERHIFNKNKRGKRPFIYRVNRMFICTIKINQEMMLNEKGDTGKDKFSFRMVCKLDCVQHCN